MYERVWQRVIMCMRKCVSKCTRGHFVPVEVATP